MDKKFTILYVDDERGNLNAFKNTFRRDYRILIAETPAEGLEILENEKIDLILSDQRMPEMTGVEFLKRAIVNHPEPNRILVTAYSDFDAIQGAINEANIFQYIKKPWDPQKLQEVIDHALDVYALREKNKALHEEVLAKNVQIEKTLEELRESDQLKDDFLQIISHEMRTPLNGLKGATQLFKIEFKGNDTTSSRSKALYDILEVSTNRLEEFLLLAERITSLKAKSYQLNSEIVDVAKIISDANSELSQTAKKNAQELTVSNCENCIVEADNEILSICVREIIHNAVKHSPPGSEISIKTEREDDTLAIEVTDQGDGFSETVLKNLFKIFIRETSNDDQSLGLNLALVKLVMDLHAGEVSVRNNETGGATVRLELKAAILPLAHRAS